MGSLRRVALPGAAGREVDHLERGADPLPRAVLEGDGGVDRDRRVAAIDRVDDVAVFLADHAAAHLAGAGQLAVIGVQLLVQQQEAADALRLRQAGIHRLDLAADQAIDLLARRQVGVGGEGDAALLRPFRDDREADADDRRQVRPAMAQDHRLADVR